VTVSRVPYSDGLAMERHRPAALADDAPVVVLVHGCCGDRRDTAGLARALARRGALVLNPDVGALAEGGGWPASYQAVACAVLTADAEAGRLAGGPHPVALVGWSEGAMVGAAVTLGWPEIAPPPGACPGRVAAAGDGPDLLVGLGGYYGWDGSGVPPEVVTDGTVAWFGAPPEADPDAWHEGNPRSWVRSARTIPPVRLIARPGDAHAAGFQSDLLARGADVTVTTIDDVSHLGLIQPRDVAGAEALAAVSDALGLPARTAPRP
jgi:acetyl esterase/lipase